MPSNESLRRRWTSSDLHLLATRPVYCKTVCSVVVSCGVSAAACPFCRCFQMSAHTCGFTCPACIVGLYLCVSFSLYCDFCSVILYLCVIALIVLAIDSILRFIRAGNVIGALKKASHRILFQGRFQTHS